MLFPLNAPFLSGIEWKVVGYVPDQSFNVPFLGGGVQSLFEFRKNYILFFGNYNYFLFGSIFSPKIIVII